MRDERSEVWYGVVEWQEMQHARQELGLPAKDLHITLGFSLYDIHSKPKTASTIIIPYQ